MMMLQEDEELLQDCSFCAYQLLAIGGYIYIYIYIYIGRQFVTQSKQNHASTQHNYASQQIKS